MKSVRCSVPEAPDVPVDNICPLARVTKCGFPADKNLPTFYASETTPASSIYYDAIYEHRRANMAAAGKSGCLWNEQGVAVETQYRNPQSGRCHDRALSRPHRLSR